MDERIIDRTERAAGVPGLVGVLADRLSATDPQSLLLAVAARRVAGLTPPDVLRRYESDRFSGPSAVDPGALPMTRLGGATGHSRGRWRRLTWPGE